jgi:regulator of replication initiation timing
MRKQAECEELAAMVAQLNAEKAHMAGENHRLRIENSQLRAQNAALQQTQLQGHSPREDAGDKADIRR